MVAAVLITPELASFFESGTTLIVGTRDACMVPECVRALGVSVQPDGGEVTAYLPEVTAGVTLANLRDNGWIAMCFTRISDHRSIQVKGRVVAIRPATGAERAVIDAHRAALSEAMGWAGVPTRTVLRFAHWPAQAVRFAVDALFVQTPGPGAGDALAGSAGER